MAYKDNQRRLKIPQGRDIAALVTAAQPRAESFASVRRMENRPVRILYLDIDTLRADHLGCYGYLRNTSPNLDRVAAEGGRFENCYVSDTPTSGAAEDPLWTVTREGGPFHTRGHLERYCARLRATGRAHHADYLMGRELEPRRNP